MEVERDRAESRQTIYHSHLGHWKSKTAIIISIFFIFGVFGSREEGERKIKV